MAHSYCSNCEAKVHLTTKVCPGCGGDFTRFFGGPRIEFGTPPSQAPVKFKISYDDVPNIPLWLVIIGIAIIVLYGYVTWPGET